MGPSPERTSRQNASKVQTNRRGGSGIDDRQFSLR
jgi:hypothetical protein